MGYLSSKFFPHKQIPVTIAVTGIPASQKKPRRVRGPQAANQVKSIFRGGVYVAKNTLRGESVPEWAFSPFGRAGRSESSFVKKGRRPFLTSSNPRNRYGYGDFLWRSGRDLNPRAAFDDNTISSRARYDHFDTTAYSCCDNSIDYYSKFSGIVKWKKHKNRKNPCGTGILTDRGGQRGGAALAAPPP